MAARRILALFSSMVTIAIAAAPPSAVAAQDVECSGVLTGVTARNVNVPRGGACILRSSTVAGRVFAPAASYFQATTTRIAGDVVGADAQTLFLDVGSSVRGSVRANRVAQVFVFGSRVRRNLRIDRATDQIYVCDSTIERGSVRVTWSSRDIVIGDPRSGECDGNTVRRGNMSVLWNTTDVQLVVSGNRFPRGNLIVAGNTGPSEKTVKDNFGGRHIACQQNAGRFRAFNNRRWKSGSCRRR